ncbi:MAG TPA: HEPN domain-containing protein [Candidatus Altiarchaeales archaeon]|nr:HEPN domain-containing protein [Candidatus Altiarchaeales archaeon]
MKNKIDLVVGWIKKGERDLKVAMRELAQQEIFTDVVCFHAQQAAEKYLKGYLVWLDIEPKRTHDLEDLVLLAGTKDKKILGLKDTLAELTPFAVESRYPEFEEPSLEDTKRAIKIAQELKDYILKRLPEEVKMNL